MMMGNGSWIDWAEVRNRCRSDALTEEGRNFTVWDAFPLQAVDELLEKGCSCGEVAGANTAVLNFHCMGFPFSHWWAVEAFFVGIFALTISLSVVGNAVVIWVILCHRKMRTVTNYFLLNLAAADLSISLFNVLFQFQFNLYYDWPWGHHYCLFSNFMSVAPTCASVFTMVSMSLDRYSAIVHPLRPRLSKTKTISIVLGIWALASTIALPHALASDLSVFFLFPPDYNRTALMATTPGQTSAAHHFRQISMCIGDNYPDGNTTTSTYYRVYNTFLLLINYLVPLVVLSGTYALVGRELWGAQAIGESIQPVQDEAVQAKRKVVKMIILIVAAFMICWLPYNLYFSVFIHILSEDETNQHVYTYLAIYWLAMSSTCVNPLICAYMNSRFRTGFRWVFRWVPGLGMSRREYEESELCRDPRKHSVSGLYRLRSVALPKRRPGEPFRPTPRPSAQLSTRESRLGASSPGENGSLLDPDDRLSRLSDRRPSDDKPSTVDLPSHLNVSESHSDSGFDPHSTLP